MLKAWVRVADKQGKFKEKLNILQYEALWFLVGIERQEAIEAEIERMKYTVFAANPRMFNALYKDESLNPDGVEWISPRSQEEIDDILAMEQEGHEDAGFLYQSNS